MGEDPFSTECLWQHMFRGSFFPANKVYSCAICAIDIALWDIKGKALGMPVYKFPGGPVRDKVMCYPISQGRTNEELLKNCVEYKTGGSSCTGIIRKRLNHSNPTALRDV